MNGPITMANFWWFNIKKHMILYNHIDPPVLVGSLGFTWLILDTPPLFGKKNESLQVAAGREA